MAPLSVTASLLPPSRCGETDKALAAASRLAAASASGFTSAAAMREGTLPRLLSRTACCSASLAADAAERGPGASSSTSPFCLKFPRHFSPFTLMTPSSASQVLTEASFASLLLMQTNRSSTMRTKPPATMPNTLKTRLTPPTTSALLLVCWLGGGGGANGGIVGGGGDGGRDGGNGSRLLST